MFAESDKEKTRDFFASHLKPKGIETEFSVYPDQVHGFAVRGDVSVDSERAAKERVTKQTVEWFQKWLA